MGCVSSKGKLIRQKKSQILAIKTTNTIASKIFLGIESIIVHEGIKYFKWVQKIGVKQRGILQLFPDISHFYAENLENYNACITFIPNTDFIFGLPLALF